MCYVHQGPGPQSPGPVPQLPIPAQFPLGTYLYPSGLIETVVSAWISTVRENEHLNNRVAQKELAEQAYTDVRDFNNCLCTFSRSGRPRVVLNHTIASALYFDCHPLLNLSPFYLIQLAGVEPVAIIPEEAFLKDNQMSSILQRMPGVEVSIQSSMKRTCTLIRHAIYRDVKEVFWDYYCGWQQKNGEWKFQIFPPFTTHQVQPFRLSAPQPIKQASAATAAFRFWDVFRVFTDEFSCKLIFLIFHAAALHTLVAGLGFKAPLAVAFFSDDPDQTTHLKQLFSWFGDPALSLDDKPQGLPQRLLTRKDQPILIIDAGRLSNKAEAMNIIEQTLATGVVSVKIGRGEKEFPVLGPVVILSSRASALTVAPDVMVLDLPSEAFNRKLWLELEDCAADNSEYLSGFLSFTEAHILELQEALKEGRRRALQLSGGELNEECAETLGVFLGLDIFLAKFSKYCTAVIAPVVRFDENTTETLVELLRQTTDKELCVNLADQFLAVGRAQIESRTIQTYRKDRAPKTEIGPIVYYDWEYLYFSSPAFFQVCDSLSQSRPAVLQALTEAGLFGGRQVNGTTAQTRITVCNVYGQSIAVKVYAISREAFDNISLGDPLVFDEEEPL